MKCTFILASCYAAGTIAYSHTDLNTISQARHSHNQLQPSSHLASSSRYQKRGIVVHSSESPQDLGKGSGKAKKAAARRGNQQQEKAANPNPSQQQQGNTGNQQKDQQKGKGGDHPKPAPQPPRLTRPIPPGEIRAEVNFRGPGYMQWARGSDMLEQEVRRGDTRHRIARHSNFVAAGGVSIADPPANAATQPFSQHPIRAYAHGPTAGAAFIIPEGGRGYATADIQGRERQTWDLRGPENRAFSVNPTDGAPVRVQASITHGGFVQASASDGSESNST